MNVSNRKINSLKVPAEWRLARRVFVGPIYPYELLMGLYVRATATAGAMKLLSAARFVREAAQGQQRTASRQTRLRTKETCFTRGRSYGHRIERVIPTGKLR